MLAGRWAGGACAACAPAPLSAPVVGRVAIYAASKPSRVLAGLRQPEAGTSTAGGRRPYTASAATRTFTYLANSRDMYRRSLFGALMLLPSAWLGDKRGVRNIHQKQEAGWISDFYVLPRPPKEEIWFARDLGVPFQFPSAPEQFSRLREHYHDTLAHDLLLLNYDHKLANKRLRRQNERRRIVQAAAEEWIEPPPVELRPEDPDPLRWDPEHGLKKPRGRRDWDIADAAAREASSSLRFRPDPDYFDVNVPQLVGVTVSTVLVDAAKNKFYLCNAYSLVQAVAGVHPTLSYSDTDNHEIELRRGMPIGCYAFLEGDDAWSLVERLLVVLPRVKEYIGVESQAGEGSSLKLSIDTADLQSFPDLEPILDNITHLSSIEIEFHTTADTPTRVRTLLSGLGIPFRDRKNDSDVIYRRNKEPEPEEYDGQRVREILDRINRRKYEDLMEEGERKQQMKAQEKADRIRRAAFAAAKAKRPPFYDWL